jgi:DNA repair exonuclease SbcCD ATPase subunit
MAEQTMVWVESLGSTFGYGQPNVYYGPSTQPLQIPEGLAVSLNIQPMSDEAVEKLEADRAKAEEGKEQQNSDANAKIQMLEGSLEAVKKERDEYKELEKKGGEALQTANAKIQTLEGSDIGKLQADLDALKAKQPTLESLMKVKGVGEGLAKQILSAHGLS